MYTKLYDYQEEAAQDIFKRMCSKELKGAYLGFETGTGKTVTSLAVADLLCRNNMIGGLIVICPVSKVNDWKEDVKKEVPDINVVLISGTSFLTSSFKS